jgi:dihydrofolate reductase
MGRTTYEMMRSFWPTPAGIASDPHMAKVMNESPKIVVSKSLTSVKDDLIWKNVRMVRDLKPDEIKQEAEGDITVLGSGSIIQQLANLGLIDEYEIIVVPVVLGAGKLLFKDIKAQELKLLDVRAFKNGLVSLRYQPS